MTPLYPFALFPDGHNFRHSVRIPLPPKGHKDAHWTMNPVRPARGTVLCREGIRWSPEGAYGSDPALIASEQSWSVPVCRAAAS